MTKQPYTNRLIHEISPHLLQHAHSPIQWYAWGADPILRAQKENKPLLLSIGFSSCHWCHLMLKETFSDPALGELLNETFINVKVDREEHPEVDFLYMELAQLMTSGQAGWPLNLLLSPELTPFFVATYLPPDTVEDSIGMRQLAQSIASLWPNEEYRLNITSEVNRVLDIIRETQKQTHRDVADSFVLELGVDQWLQRADPFYGGSSPPPKFPMGYHLSFLTNYAHLTRDQRCYFYIERTLEGMRRGGIHDQLGGGFCRYSTDMEWIVPQFEKMLYDNALLAQAYFDGWQYTKKSLYREVCTELCSFLLESLQNADGGFSSSLDASYQGEEGRYYTWTMEEIHETLGAEEGADFCSFYGVTETGNFQGRNILHTLPPQQEDVEIRNGHERFRAARQKLKIARDSRANLFKDDKILTSWNALAIHSLARIGTATQDTATIEAALNAAFFLKENLWKNELFHTWRVDEAYIPGFLNDYVFLIRALLTLFEEDHGSEWLGWAFELCEMVEKRFASEIGAYYFSDGKDPHLIIRRSHLNDGAEPSGNAIHCENNLRLYQITRQEKYLNRAKKIFYALTGLLENDPAAYTYHLMNLLRYYDKQAPQIVIALNDDNTYKDEIQQQLAQRFSPHQTVIWRRSTDSILLQQLPYLEGLSPIDKQTTLYLFRQGKCEQPLHHWPDIANALRS